MRLIQFLAENGTQHVGCVADDGRSVRAVGGFVSSYELAQAAIARRVSVDALAQPALTGEALPYDVLLREQRVLTPLAHPDVAHCFVTGTGLTHTGSASARDAMHQKLSGGEESLSDSMRIFKWGMEGGRPADGLPGVQPEWFYKGDGSAVRASGEALHMPDFALDGGEEPEIAGLYLIGGDGQPYRLGFAIGNEFSDHVTERQNYLYLAHSKLRACGVGPALLVGELPAHIDGVSRVLGRDGQVRWEKAFVSGEQNMSHTIANLEHHHFKYEIFKRPGDVHIHFFGTATLSFADGISVQPGETFEIEAPAFGPALRNPLAVTETSYAKVKAL